MGRNLVQIFGDGFRLPTVPGISDGPLPDPTPTIEVLFGDEPGLNPRVLRSNRIAVNAPISPVPPRLIKMSGTPQLTFADSNPDTITRDAGSWLDDGFVVGHMIEVRGVQDNVGEFTLAAVTDLVLTLRASDSLTAEGPVSGGKVFTRSYGEGTVDVTVRNLDDNGDPIPGEEVVVTNGYTFARVQLAIESVLTRLVRTLVQELRRQVIPNVSVSEHTEFDPDTGDLLSIAALATLPGLALAGPDLTPSRGEYQVHERQTRLNEAGEVEVLNAPDTNDLEFAITVVSDSKVELLNLQSLLKQFMERNPYLYMVRDPSDPSQGRVKWEMDWTPGTGLSTSRSLNEANLRSFSGTLVVVGFDFEELPGFAGESVVDLTTQTDEVGVTFTLSQTGESYDVGPSPGGDC